MIDNDVSAPARQPGSNALLLAEAISGWYDKSPRARLRRQRARLHPQKNRYRSLEQDPWKPDELVSEIMFLLDGQLRRLPLAKAEDLASRLGYKREYLIVVLKKKMGRPDLAEIFTQEPPVGGDVWLYGERTARRERQRDAARRKKARASQERTQ